MRRRMPPLPEPDGTSLKDRFETLREITLLLAKHNSEEQLRLMAAAAAILGIPVEHTMGSR